VGEYTGLLFLAVPLLLLYMVAARSRRQQRTLVVIQDSVQPGMRVMTTSGLHATVVSLEDPDIVVLEIAPGVHTRWAKPAIAQVFDDSVAADSDLVESGTAGVVDLSTGSPAVQDDAVPRRRDGHDDRTPT
jgi:preprotein translocase subunit YajC